MDLDDEESKCYVAMVNAERRARADAYIFRRAAWVWGVFCSLVSIPVLCELATCGGSAPTPVMTVQVLAGMSAMALVLPAGITAMQVAKLVWRRWRDSRRGEG